MLIVILGSPNDANGNLLPFAISRCETAFNLYQEIQHIEPCYIVCTGGFGKHFNQTETPHAEYVKQYLLQRGVDDNVFLPHVLSRFTIEDASLAKSQLESFENENIAVITSDFHIERVQAVFSFLYPHLKLSFIASPSKITSLELNRLQQHEQKALKRDLATLKSLHGESFFHQA